MGAPLELTTLLGPRRVDPGVVLLIVVVEKCTDVNGLAECGASASELVARRPSWLFRIIRHVYR
jgi:hypothetical protein